MPRQPLLGRVMGSQAQGLPRPRSLLYLLPTAAAILGLVSFLLSVQTSRVTTSGYDIRRLEQVRQEWQEQNRLLEAEIAALQSLDRAEREAKGPLQMIPATQYIYVMVDEAAPTRIATPAVVQEGAPQRPPWWRVLWRRLIPWD